MFYKSTSFLVCKQIQSTTQCSLLEHLFINLNPSINKYVLSMFDLTLISLVLCTGCFGKKHRLVCSSSMHEPVVLGFVLKISKLFKNVP